MNESLRKLLAEVAAGRVGPEEAAERLAPFADLGFAKLDVGRELRTGAPEAVFGAAKTPEDLERIVAEMLERTGRVLVTRLDQERGERLCRRFPDASYHARARVLTAGEAPTAAAARSLAVLAAGTSDLPVAEEAAVVAEWLGVEVSRHYDVGIAGVERLLARLEAVRAAGVVVAVAGMDGALPTLVAGLVRSPVVAVPTSVGYGASFGGVAPLLTMLTGCAPGVAVVNIDNGYGAAVLAHRILTAPTSR